ncbi:hypothetical protein FIBSPDRAFT_926324 [Athelia psychrophila]|uniref:BTB domain-containing protein n=1 Tax=Athelia psychrophila TaxID=1759441 RepID=A0A166TC78_9AGAM|nr:hypothetical protein FIBSPDRAFT_926324 [Fibularhizoctonia sp. CBS 109695]
MAEDGWELEVIDEKRCRSVKVAINVSARPLSPYPRVSLVQVVCCAIHWYFTLSHHLHYYMSASDQPPALKRKRTEDESLEGSTTPAPLVRSDIWYDDGNVILQAGCTQFKLYRGVLGENSSVFKDMFSFPQPPLVGTELVDGCPVVHLSDSAEDVKYVLQAICPREETHYKWTLVQEPGCLFELVTFARTTGMLSILPGVLYTCCNEYSASEIIGGVKGTDGYISSLRTEDQLACLAGHRAICVSQLQTTYDWLSSDYRSAGCISIDHCRKVRQNFMMTHFTATSLSPIGGLDLWGDRRLSNLMCLQCTGAAKKSHGKRWLEFYELLPSLFGLPPWAELLKEREAME